jgi:hypothetical protein
MSAEDDASTSAAGLVSAIAAPKRVTTDGVTVESQPIPDLIALDQYLSAKAAVSTRRGGLIFNRLIPDGAVNRRGYRGVGAQPWPTWQNY